MEFFLLNKNFKTMRNLMLTFCLSALVSVAFSQIKVIAPDGNVAIGGSTAEAKLDVTGDVIIRGSLLNIGNNASTFNDLVSLKIGGDRSASGKAAFELISDKDNYPDWGFRFIRFASGHTNLDHRGGKSLSFNNQDGAATYFGTFGEARFSVHTDQIYSYVQAFKLGGGMWATTSDKRVKKDINLYKKGLKEILSINPVSYKYDKAIVNLSDETYVGVIAQEVQEVVPTMVKEHDFTDISKKKHEGYLSVDPNEFTYMLINSIKEQQQLIESLQKNNSVLESKLINLSETVENLQLYSSGISATAEGAGKAYLAQNMPNPIKEYTEIKFFIPNEANKAFLTIQNLSGQLIKRIDITENGSGYIDLNLVDLPSGLYSYKLNVDGITVDTKKMIVE